MFTGSFWFPRGSPKIGLIDKVGSKCGFSQFNIDTYIILETLFCCNGSAYGVSI